MAVCLFASDFHGELARYRALVDAVASRRPDLVLLGGDLLPHEMAPPRSLDPDHADFVHGTIAPLLRGLRERLGSAYPPIAVILGNDDARFQEPSLLDLATQGLLHYVHQRRLAVGDVAVYGYACVPPTPFQLKDWERYDVGRFVDVGCVSPEAGRRTVPVAENLIRWGTIAGDLRRLAGDDDLARAIVLFHAPPYDTALDLADLDGRSVDHAPVDPHVGSVAIRRFIEGRHPLVTLHGHVHEAARLTGRWRDRLGTTHCFGAAHDGPELALVRFDTDDLDAATRELV